MKEKNQFVLPLWDELPEIGLYAHQVLSYFDELFSTLFDDETVLTKTMINNYVKEKLVPPPMNKRYAKDSIATLMMIIILKKIYSIKEIKKLVNIYINPESYDLFVQCFNDALNCFYEGKSFIPASSVEYLVASIVYVYHVLEKI